MKIHNNNFLKNLGPSAEQMQRAFQAEQAAMGLRTESEIAEKLRKVRETLDEATRNNGAGPSPVKNNQDSPSKEAAPRENPENESPEDQAEGTSGEEGPPPPPVSHIDIRV